jgi:hypothetical protein
MTVSTVLLSFPKYQMKSDEREQALRGSFLRKSKSFAQQAEVGGFNFTFQLF